jgi:hypothetical protein
MQNGLSSLPGERSLPGWNHLGIELAPVDEDRGHASSKGRTSSRDASSKPSVEVSGEEE